ncbi:MAG: hypothetical protein KAI70_07050 [Candidatus Omnitrophica bacterium]|nr:hypothetical protein [Candidatus Omnitrophota bacterium]
MKNKYELIWIVMFLIIIALLSFNIIMKRLPVITPSGSGGCDVAACIEVFKDTGISCGVGVDGKIFMECNVELGETIEETRRGRE